MILFKNNHHIAAIKKLKYRTGCYPPSCTVFAGTYLPRFPAKWPSEPKEGLLFSVQILVDKMGRSRHVLSDHCRIEQNHLTGNLSSRHVCFIPSVRFLSDLNIKSSLSKRLSSSADGSNCQLQIRARRCM